MGTNTDARRRGARAITTDAFRLLLADWETQSTSRRYRRRLRQWARREPALAVDAPQALIEATNFYAKGNHEQDRACAVLEALARLSQAGDELATLTILRILVPRLTVLVDQYHRPDLDVDDRSAMALTIAGETVARCVPGTASTPYDFRLWSNIRKRFGRHVSAHCRRSSRLDLVEPTVLVDRADTARQHSDRVVDDDIGELCGWVAERAALDLGTARLIVLTRVGGVAVEDLVDIEGWCAQTLWKRRKRAERRLETALSA